MYGCKNVNWWICWRHHFHLNVTLGRQISFLLRTHNAIKTIMLVIYVSTTTKIKLRGNFLLNMTYHITLLSILRDCSFWTLSNCVTHSFTTTASSSLLNIHCHFAWIPFSLHNIWITNLVSTCRSIYCYFLPFQIIVIEFLHSFPMISSLPSVSIMYPFGPHRNSLGPLCGWTTYIIYV